MILLAAKVPNDTLLRKSILDTLALASLEEFHDAWRRLDHQPEVTSVRGPEAGLVMVRGRTGGTGQPFNFGEVVVSRATVQLQSGLIGHGHVLGNALEKAKFVATFDALAQDEEHRFAVEALVDEVASRVAKEALQRAQEVAATRVEFFTMVRGDD
jgi:alpha-D-ribose 1-methylphosphonate 5-triphosphate synthase subunit PhnG